MGLAAATAGLSGQQQQMLQPQLAAAATAAAAAAAAALGQLQPLSLRQPVLLLHPRSLLLQPSG
jgi:hypothetical protein